LVTRVGVVFGGASAEREVSIVSARTILGGLARAGLAGVPIAVDPSGCFRGNGDSAAILERGFGAVRPASVRLPEGRFDGIDVAFPIVHGETGEDGTLQGFFETLGIPYAGSDVAGSALGMNKAAFKARMRDAGIPVARSVAIDRREWVSGASTAADAIARRLPLPVFVKPSSGGSSLGVTKVKEWDALGGAMEDAFAYDRTVLVEEGLDAREIECAVLGNDDAEASGCGEIVPGREFYDYEDKYISDGARLLVPAPLEESVAESVRDLARRAFALCGCAGFARVDFFVGRADGRVFVNELNTLPGFTSISMYPKLWEHAGVSLPELIVRIVSLAKERSESRTRDRAGRAAPKKLG
jgi:D-alanine-D-alanine ligase